MEVVVMPKLGFNMDEGKLMTWYKAEGDRVEKGEPLFSIETDKTAIDVEATLSGVVRRLFIGEGDSVPVTLPIAIIGEEGEDIAAAEAEALSQLIESASFVSAGGAAPAPEAPAPEAQAEAAPAPASSAPAPASSAPAAAAPKPATGSDSDYDVIVIGGGPGGYVAAIKAAQLGLKVAIAEKDKFGGTCLNRGCIPTKTLLRSLAALGEAKDAASFGVIGVDAKKAALDMKKVQARKKSIVDGLVGGVAGLMGKNKIKVFEGEAKITDANTVTISGKNYSTGSIIIATGSEVKSLPQEIIAKKDVLTSDELLDLKEIPKEITIIGGGVIGVEFAYFLAGAGSKVTIVEFLPRILPPVDAEIAGLVTKDLESMGIKIFTDAKVTKITDKTVEFEKGGKTEKVSVKSVLMAVGRTPHLSIDTDALGIKTNRGAIVTDEYMRTSVPNIYAIGDVNAKVMLAHTASAEGIVAAKNIAGIETKMSYGAIPSAIYIKPEVASVGLSEEDAKEKFGDIKVGKFPVMANGKSKVEGDERGLIKVITDARYGEILGVHLYCAHATDMIAEAVVAITAEATAETIAETIHPHPTVSEGIMEAFHAAGGGGIHC